MTYLHIDNGGYKIECGSGGDLTLGMDSQYGQSQQTFWDDKVDQVLLVGMIYRLFHHIASRTEITGAYGDILTSIAARTPEELGVHGLTFHPYVLHPSMPLIASLTLMCLAGHNVSNSYAIIHAVREINEVDINERLMAVHLECERPGLLALVMKEVDAVYEQYMA